MSTCNHWNMVDKKMLYDKKIFLIKILQQRNKQAENEK